MILIDKSRSLVNLEGSVEELTQDFANVSRTLYQSLTRALNGICSRERAAKEVEELLVAAVKSGIAAAEESEPKKPQAERKPRPANAAAFAAALLRALKSEDPDDAE